MVYLMWAEAKSKRTSLPDGFLENATRYWCWVAENQRKCSISCSLSAKASRAANNNISLQTYIRNKGPSHYRKKPKTLNADIRANHKFRRQYLPLTLTAGAEPVILAMTEERVVAALAIRTRGTWIPCQTHVFICKIKPKKLQMQKIITRIPKISYFYLLSSKDKFAFHFEMIWFNVVRQWHTRSGTRAPPMLACKYVDGNGSATMLVTKKSGGIAPEVNLRNLLHACHETNNWGIHSGFEIQGRCHQKSKTGVSVAPTLMSSKN